MKIVINDGYGGFGLSPIGIKKYLELKGKQAYYYKQMGYVSLDRSVAFKRVDDIENIDCVFWYCTTYDQGEVLSDYPKDIFYSHNIERNDPTLVQVVEELGAKASGRFSKLVVKEIENGRYFKITEYDGWESIEYRDIDDDWTLAVENDYD